MQYWFYTIQANRLQFLREMKKLFPQSWLLDDSVLVVALPHDAILTPFQVDLSRYKFFVSSIAIREIEHATFLRYYRHLVSLGVTMPPIETFK